MLSSPGQYWGSLMGMYCQTLNQLLKPSIAKGCRWTTTLAKMDGKKSHIQFNHINKIRNTRSVLLIISHYCYQGRNTLGQDLLVQLVLLSPLLMKHCKSPFSTLQHISITYLKKNSILIASSQIMSNAILQSKCFNIYIVRSPKIF